MLSLDHYSSTRPARVHTAVYIRRVRIHVLNLVYIVNRASIRIVYTKFSIYVVQLYTLISARAWWRRGGVHGGLAYDRVCTVRLLISEKSFLLTHTLSSNLHTEGNFHVRFSLRKSIQCSTLYRLTSSFLRYMNILMCKFADSVSCLGLYGGLYGQNLQYKFKKSYGDFRNRNFEKPYRTTGPRSDLRPDS
jgi:hypothetical protein